MSEWQRPKGCSTLECIEIQFLPDSEAVAVRSARYGNAHPYGVVLATNDEWRVFVAAVKNGEFDDPLV